MIKRLRLLAAVAALTGSAIGAGLRATPATHLASGAAGGVVNTATGMMPAASASASTRTIHPDSGRGGISGDF